jgi:hypothetical protein
MLLFGGGIPGGQAGPGGLRPVGAASAKRNLAPSMHGCALKLMHVEQMEVLKGKIIYIIMSKSISGIAEDTGKA